MTADEFKRLFLPCNQQLYRVAFRLTRNRDDAADMVQETYLKIWNIRDRLDQVDNPSAFCMTTLKNVYIDSLRRSRLELDSTPDAETIERIADADLVDLIEARDSCSLVNRLIELLPDNQRQVITMRDIADLSFEDIQSATGLSPGNVRTLLSRARKKIKQQFIAIMKYERN